MANLAQVIKNLRIDRGITQEQLASLLKVSRSTIGMYETGSRQPDVETCEAIADIFNVDMDYLMGRSAIERKSPLFAPNRIEQTSPIDHFRDNLAHLIETSDTSDLADAGVNVSRLYDIVEGRTSVSLSEACSIADEFGCTLDELVSPNKKEPSAENDEELKEAMTIFRSLSADNRSKLLELGRLYSDAQRKAQGSQ